MGGPPSTASVRGAGASRTCRRSRFAGRARRSVAPEGGEEAGGVERGQSRGPSRAAMRAAAAASGPWWRAARAFAGRGVRGGAARRRRPGPARVATTRSKCGAANHVVGDRRHRRPAAQNVDDRPERSMPGLSWQVGGFEHGTAGSVRARCRARPACAARQVEVVRVGRRLAVEADRGEGRPRRGGRDVGGGEPSCAARTSSGPTHPLDRCSSGFWNTNPTVAAAPLDRAPVRRSAVEPDVAPGGAAQAVEMLDEGRLARPVLAEDRDRLAR